MNEKNDYLIVGVGLFGVVYARQMYDAGKRCMVIDKRPHIRVYQNDLLIVDFSGVKTHLWIDIMRLSEPEIIGVNY